MQKKFGPILKKMLFQNRVTSEQQSTAIIKSLTKLPKYFEAVIFPTLVTIVTDNETAKAVVARDFDITVRDD